MITGPYRLVGERVFAVHHWERHGFDMSHAEARALGKPELAGSPGPVLEKGTKEVSILEFDGWVCRDDRERFVAALNAAEK